MYFSISSLPSSLGTGFIRQLKLSSFRYRSRFDGKAHDKYSYKKPLDISLKCKSCHNIGNYVAAEGYVCYTLAKAHFCSKFLSDSRNIASITKNTLLFQQNQKDKFTKLKTVIKIDRYMRTLRDENQSEDKLNPLVNLCLTLKSDPDQESYKSTDTASVNECHSPMVMVPPVVHPIIHRLSSPYTFRIGTTSIVC